MIPTSQRDSACVAGLNLLSKKRFISNRVLSKVVDDNEYEKLLLSEKNVTNIRKHQIFT